MCLFTYYLCVYYAREHLFRITVSLWGRCTWENLISNNHVWNFWRLHKPMLELSFDERKISFIAIEDVDRIWRWAYRVGIFTYKWNEWEITTRTAIMNNIWCSLWFGWYSHKIIVNYSQWRTNRKRFKHLWILIGWCNNFKTN